MPNTLNNFSIVFFILSITLLLFLKKKYAVFPLFLATCYTTSGVGFNIASINFFLLRAIILFAWVRIIIRKEFFSGPLNRIDKAILYYVIVSGIVYFVRVPNLDSVINRLGIAYDSFGLYFYFRSEINGEQEIVDSIKFLSILIIPLSVFMLLEHFTGRNLYSIIGGVPEFSMVRYGVVRSQGPFSHPIMAGSFGVSLLPLMFYLWHNPEKTKILFILSIISAHIIAFSASSSGPALTYIFAIIGIFTFRFRKNIKYLPWALIILLITLNFMMNAPVWFIIDRIGEYVGSTGHAWYRSAIIDRAINHIDEWWLLGTDYTAHWGLTVLPFNPNNIDITNQYIRVGVEGGLISLILFFVVVKRGFNEIIYLLFNSNNKNKYHLRLVWLISIAFLCHTITFISVSYLDQMVVLWYFVLACLSTLSDTNKQPRS